MKFSTITTVNVGTAGQTENRRFHFAPGISFACNGPSPYTHVFPLEKPSAGVQGAHEYKRSYMFASNSLFASSDSFVHQGFSRVLTVLKGSVRRIESEPVLFTEAEADTAESKRHGHVVYVPAHVGEIAKVEDASLADRLLIPRVAVLLEGEQLTILRCHSVEVPAKSWRQEATRVLEVHDTFQISYDGTELQVHGVERARKSPESYC